MAVPGLRHGHMDALLTEKINPTVFTRQKNVCASPDRVGRSQSGLDSAGDLGPGDGASPLCRARRARWLSRGGRPRPGSGRGWRGRSASACPGTCTAPRGGLPSDAVPEWRDIALELRDGTAEPLLVIHSVEEKLEHVAAGTGISIIPISTASFYTRPDVVHIPVEDIAPNWVCLAWIASRRSRTIYDFAEIATTLAQED